MERIDKSHILTAKDVEAMPLIKAYADFLKRSGKIELPKLHDLMRTKVYSEYTPYDDDWYYIRCGECFISLSYEQLPSLATCTSDPAVSTRSVTPSVPSIVTVCAMLTTITYIPFHTHSRNRRTAT